MGPGNAEALHNKVQELKESVAKDTGVDIGTVSVKATDDGRLTVLIPRADPSESKKVAEDKLSDSLKKGLVASDVVSGENKVQEEAFSDVTVGLKGIRSEEFDDDAKEKGATWSLRLLFLGEGGRGALTSSSVLEER